LWLRDLAAYSIQAAALVGVGVAMARVLRLRVPRVRHAYWQALLTVCVLLPLLQLWRPEVLESSGAVFTNFNLKAASAPVPTGPSVAEIVLWLICTGIVLRLVWVALGFGRLYLYRRHAQRIEQAPEAVEEAQRLAPVSPSFFISHQLPTPAAFGSFRPAILFPTRFLEMEPAMQKAIALHELLHVERRDWLWNMFEEIVLTLLWFHLPLWWVVRSARLSREQVVDAEAIRRSKARRPYLKALLEMAGQKRLAESLPAPLFLRENQLAERVALMMKEVHMTRTRLTVSILTAAVTLLIAGATLVWAFPLKTSSLQAETPAAASAPGPAETGNADGTSLPENAVAAESEANPKIGKVYKVEKDVSAPIPIYKPEPRYSPEAKKDHLTGTAVFTVVIDADGKVVSVKQLSKPLGEGLDESCVKTIRSWRFKPAIRKGKPVPVQVSAEVSFRHYDDKKSDPSSQNSDPEIDPPAQGTQSASADANKNHKTYVNQAEIQRQVDEAMKQAKIAQDAASKIDQKKIQEQLDQAMKQAKIAQKNFAKIDQAKIEQQIEEAMKKAQIAQAAASRIDQAMIQQQVDEAMKHLQEMNTPEMRLKMQEQMNQLEKMNTPEMRQQLKQAMEQARIAQESAAKIKKGEIRRQLEQARKQVEQARKEAEKTNEQKKKQPNMLLPKKAEPLPPSPVLPAPTAPPAPEQKASAPAPPASPQPPPVPPSSEELSLPPAPPASPVPPPPPQN